MYFIYFIIALFFSIIPATAAKNTFTLWQLPSQINTIGNSYIILTRNGKVVVMDGGVKEEAPYLRGFLAALGNEVEAWFVTHPHPDHIGALTEILKTPQGIVIKKLYQSEFSPAFRDTEPDCAPAANAYYDALAALGVPVTNYATPGAQLDIDGVNFKILTVTNENIRVNPYNNSSMAIRVWDKKKSILFLADLGLESGDLLLNGPYRKDLDCDYLQMAHHGQRGVSKDFYRTVKFSACLWPTPSWVYNNDAGNGFNTHTLETVEIRELMEELGITRHYISFEGLSKIE
jgi:beta-lactamase superfamily II metal-dependent hydrolase